MSGPPRKLNLKSALRVSARQPRDVLSREELQFAEEYIVDLNPKAAAGRIGLEPDRGRRLLSLPRVQAAIQTAKAQRSRRTQIYSDEVLRSWDLARRVDYNEFVSIVVPPCRYCWGTNHHYQFTTLLEMKRQGSDHAVEQSRYSERLRRDFDTEGGEGYNVLQEPCRGPEWGGLGYIPNSDHSCPECNGVGDTPRVLIRDTRKLSHGALYLYEGVAVGKSGELKINIRGRRDFDEMIGRHLGILNASSQAGQVVDPSKMSDDQLDQVLQAHGVKVDIEHEPLDETITEVIDEA